jgi:hypothetical protein
MTGILGLLQAVQGIKTKKKETNLRVFSEELLLVLSYLITCRRASVLLLWVSAIAAMPAVAV